MKHTKKALFFRLLWYIIMILVSLVFCFPVLYLIFTGFKLSLIHISEPTRRTPISYAVFCLKKKKQRDRQKSQMPSSA